MMCWSCLEMEYASKGLKAPSNSEQLIWGLGLQKWLITLVWRLRILIHAIWEWICRNLQKLVCWFEVDQSTIQHQRNFWTCSDDSDAARNRKGGFWMFLDVFGCFWDRSLPSDWDRSRHQSLCGMAPGHLLRTLAQLPAGSPSREQHGGDDMDVMLVLWKKRKR